MCLYLTNKVIIYIIISLDSLTIGLIQIIILEIHTLKAMKRKVDNEIYYRELRLVRRSIEGIIESGLEASYRLHICIEYDGNAH